MALGAQVSDIRRLVLGEAIWLALAGAGLEMQRICLTILALVVALLLTSSITQAQSIQGTWQIEEWVLGNGTVRVNPRGLWFLGERHYSYAIVGGDREREPLRPPQTPGQPTDADKISFAEHVAPFLIAAAGTYDFDGTTITYHPMANRVEGPNFPADQKFELSFDGNDKVTLLLPNGGRMVFNRVE